MKKAIRVLIKIIFTIVIFLLVYVIFVFLIPYIGVNKKHISTKEDVTIFIKTNGVHTDIVVPIKTEYKDWSKKIKALRVWLNLEIDSEEVRYFTF